MTKLAVFTLRARRELALALERIAKDNPDAAERLNDAVRETALLIGTIPAVGTHRPRLAGARYRFWLIPRYGYLVAYTDATDPPRLVRIVDTSRDLPHMLAEPRG